MCCNGSNWAVYSPGSWDGFRNDVWALWAGVIMHLEHHLVGGYVRYISPHIIIIIIVRSKSNHYHLMTCVLPAMIHCSDGGESLAHTHTHTQTCKHRQTGSSHCSSFVYTLTFSQHLSYVLYTFGKRGPFSNWGPYCSFCYKSPVWMPKQTHTHTHTHTHKLVNTGKRGPPIVPLLFIL